MYNPQKTPGKPYKAKRSETTEIYRNTKRIPSTNVDGLRHPYSWKFFKKSSKRGMHPTKKPIELMEYLMKSYTNENDIILDFAMGSGSTGVACKKNNRKFVGIELDKNYFEIACKRLSGGRFDNKQ